MRNPNGYGGVSRLPGNRRRPYRVRITTGWDTRSDGTDLQQFTTLGYYETRSEAMIALAEYNRGPYDLGNRSMTFAQVYERWRPEYFQKYPSTQRVTESAMALCRPIWNVPLRELRTGELQEVIRLMGDKSRGYQSKVRSLMHMLFRWGMSRGIVDRDWSQFVELTAEERETRRRVFTPQEIRILWEVWRGERPLPTEPERFRGLGLTGSVLLLLYTGLRVGELLELRRQDVKLRERYIDLRGTKTRAARRQVPLHRQILPVMERMISRGGDNLLPAPDGGKLTYAQYKYGWFDKTLPGLGMDHTPHDTRHTFVSALDSAGVRRGAVMFIVGHSQRDVTDRYTHKDIPELIGEVDKISYDC